MEPYIKTIDTTKTIGKLIYEYGEIKYRNGFLLGFIFGFLTGITIIKIKN